MRAASPSSASAVVYDKIIVGAGTAGCILAARLSEDASCQVLLIEAGPDLGTLEELPEAIRFGYPNVTNPPQISPFVKQLPARGSSNRDVQFAWGELVGGGSAINAQVFLRPLDLDFASWEKAGNTEWTYEKSLPSMNRIEHDLDFNNPFHGSDGPVLVKRFFDDDSPASIHGVFAGAKDLGFAECRDLNAPGAAGVGATPFNADGPIRVSASVAYLDAARDRPNLTIVAKTAVSHLLIEGSTAVGVVLTNADHSLQVRGHEILVSAGAIGSPQLLLRSGIGSAGELAALGIAVAADLPGVGKGLNDHPLIRMFWSVGEVPVDPGVPGSPLRVRYSSDEYPGSNDMLINVSGAHSAGIRTSVDRLELTALLMLPESTGSVSLTTNNPADPVKIDFNYFATSSDRKRMLDAIALSNELVASSAMSFLKPAAVLPSDLARASQSEVSEWLMGARLETGLHVTSSCRMGDSSDQQSVVDQYGRVHGVEGLRVVDASILPTSPRVNTNASAMLVAERVAELMKSGM